jgi:hypothetical protein
MEVIMKTYATVTGRVVLALLLSASPLFGNGVEQKSLNETKQAETQEDTGWSTRTKISVGAAVALSLGGAYATYHFKPELVKSLANSMHSAGITIGHKAVVAKNVVVNKTRSLLGYNKKPKTISSRVQEYKLNALTALGLIAQPESFGQKVKRTAASAYAASLPFVNKIQNATLKTVKDRRFALAGALMIPTSVGGVYIGYKTPAPESTTSEITEESTPETIQNTPEQNDKQLSIISGISCGIRNVKPVKQSQPRNAGRSGYSKSNHSTQYGVKSGSGCINGSCSINRSSVPAKKKILTPTSSKKSKSNHPGIKYRSINKCGITRKRIIGGTKKIKGGTHKSNRTQKRNGGCISCR